MAKCIPHKKLGLELFVSLETCYALNMETEGKNIDDEYIKIEGVTYDNPNRIEAYTGKEDEDFERGWEKYPAVWQGGGKLVEGGRIYSDGFSQCSAFVIRNTNNRQSGLFHISDIDFELEHQKLLEQFFLEWLATTEVDEGERVKLSRAISDICWYRYPRTMKREEIAPRLQSLGIASSIKADLFCADMGRYSIDTRLRDSLLGFLGVTLPSTHVFQNFQTHWSIIADFDSQVVKVNVPSKKTVLEYEI